MSEDQNLSAEQRARIGAEADAFIRLLEQRHGVTWPQIIEATRWVHHHREFVERMKAGGLLSLVGIVISASMLAFWEGFKAYMRGQQK